MWHLVLDKFSKHIARRDVLGRFIETAFEAGCGSDRNDRCAICGKALLPVADLTGSIQVCQAHEHAIDHVVSQTTAFQCGLLHAQSNTRGCGARPDSQSVLIVCGVVWCGRLALCGVVWFGLCVVCVVWCERWALCGVVWWVEGPDLTRRKRFTPGW